MSEQWVVNAWWLLHTDVYNEFMNEEDYEDADYKPPGNVRPLMFPLLPAAVSRVPRRPDMQRPSGGVQTKRRSSTVKSKSKASSNATPPAAETADTYVVRPAGRAFQRGWAGRGAPHHTAPHLTSSPPFVLARSSAAENASGNGAAVPASAADKRKRRASSPIDDGPSRKAKKFERRLRRHSFVCGWVRHHLPVPPVVPETRGKNHPSCSFPTRNPRNPRVRHRVAGLRMVLT